MSTRQRTLTDDYADEDEDDGAPQFGGNGLPHVLYAIDPSTLPRDGWIQEVARRVQAKEQGLDGWQTGEIEASLDGFERGGE